MVKRHAPSARASSAIRPISDHVRLRVAASADALTALPSAADSLVSVYSLALPPLTSLAYLDNDHAVTFPENGDLHIGVGSSFVWVDETRPDFSTSFHFRTRKVRRKPISLPSMANFSVFRPAASSHSWGAPTGPPKSLWSTDPSLLIFAARSTMLMRLCICRAVGAPLVAVEVCR